MVSGYRSGGKIAEAPTLVNSNNAEISKNTPPHETARRNSLFFCDAKKEFPLRQPKYWHFQACPLQDQAKLLTKKHHSRPVICLMILAAMHAAPKPLSILTTAIPGAQLLSIPKSAAIPPRPVP